MFHHTLAIYMMLQSTRSICERIKRFFHTQKSKLDGSSEDVIYEGKLTRHHETLVYFLIHMTQFHSSNLEENHTFAEIPVERERKCMNILTYALVCLPFILFMLQ